MKLAERVARRFVARKQRQRGQAKRHRQMAYRHQKAKAKRQAKQWRKRNQAKVKRYRKRYQQNPNRFKMKHAGGIMFAEEMPFWDLEHGFEGDVQHVDPELELIQTTVNGEPREYGLDSFLDSVVLIDEEDEDQFFGELDKAFEVDPDEEEDLDADDDGIPDSADPGFDLM